MLKLFNSLTQRLETFKPENPDKVKMYVCGPTVYDRPHIGNARSTVVYDVLFRVLRHIYGDDKVMYVRNITDVDDKIILASKKTGATVQEITRQMTNWFHQDIAALNVLRPSLEPKATEHIDDMINMIQVLISKGSAYLSNNHVYFEVSSFPNYGQLASKDVEQLRAGSRIEVSQDKRAPEDFVLWKPQDEDDDASAVFDSPWGKGRPGWHIECSAMSTKYLGSNFDIHGGGVDLIFPHHTNEIAQSCACYPNSHYARYWIHNGFLTVNDEKMSKSLGNFFTVKDLLDQSVKGEVIRYVYLSTHYRKPLNWTQKGVMDAKKSLDHFYRIIQENTHTHILRVDEDILSALSNDLNTPEVLGIMHTLAKQYNSSADLAIRQKIAGDIYSAGMLLGLFYTTPNDWFRSNTNNEMIEQMIRDRQEAKRLRNFSKADEIRNELKAMNIVLEDKPDGTTDWREDT